MCGIVGTIGKKVDKNFISDSIQSLKHRGPDSDGFWISENGRAFLGHTRLSIIDLSDAGSQPMKIIDKQGNNFIIVFNGEIYNYKEIKRELIDFGCDFISDSDTEVILRSFMLWGKKCVEKFRGMFAFAIYSENEEKIYLCRDRFGVKPLYYYKNNGCFIFASELRAICKHGSFNKQINHAALSFYFQLGYIPAPYTIFENTYKLEAGSWLEIDVDLNIKKEKYWSPQQYFTNEYLNFSEDEVVNNLEKKLIESFQYRMVADVDVGIFLSGGVDSSLVAALLQKHSSKKLKTFTIGFEEEEYDEAPNAKKIAQSLETDHHEFYISSKQASDALEDYMDVFDEPFGDSSGLPTYLLSKYTKEYVKVALSGDGGDELFAGYTKYEAVLKLKNMSALKKFCLRILFKIFNPSQLSSVYNLFAKNEHSNLREKLAKLSNVLSKNNLEDMFRAAGTYWTEGELDSLLLKKADGDLSQYFKFDDSSIVEDQIQLCDMDLYLPDDIMVKTDRSTMAAGLEGREPFLDHNLLAFISKINPKIKNKNYGSKYLLKQVLFKYLDKDLFGGPKTGFRSPLKEWLKNELAGKVDYYLSSEKIKKQGFLNHVFVKNVVDDFRSDKKYVNPDKLWLLLVFQMWYENFYE